MATINNSDTIKRILDDAGIQTSHDNVPKQLASKVVPVLVSNPAKISNVVSSTYKPTTGNGTIYTTPENKDFYLTAIQVGLSKDVVCDVATGRISVYADVNNELTEILVLPVITLTVEKKESVITLPYPIKIDRGSAIYISGTYAAGVMVRTGVVYGFTVED